MKNILFLICSIWLLCPTSAIAQTPETYTNTRGTAHRQFPGTNVWVVPPKGFTAAVKASPGFYKDEFNFVVVEELVGSNFQFAYGIRRQMDEDYAFQAEKLLKINGLDACEMQYFDAGARKVGCHTLIIGNDRFAAIVRFFYRTPETSTEAVAACLHSVFVDVEQYPDPLKAAGFKLDAAAYGYGLVDSEDDMFMFVPMDGATNPESIASMLMVGIMYKKDLGETAPPLTEVHSAVISDLPFPDGPDRAARVAGSPLTFKGHAARETTAVLMNEGKEMHFYAVTVDLPNRFCTILISTKTNHAAEMSRAKKILDTIQFF